MTSGQRPPDRPPAAAADAARRLAAIVEAAEEVAASVVDEAEAQARARLEAARADADRLVAARLRELADELDPDVRGRPPHLKSVDSEPGSGSAERPVVLRHAGSSGARLLATQMAVSGSSRQEIEARLRSGFDIEDTDEILDAILGPEE